MNKLKVKAIIYQIFIENNSEPFECPCGYDKFRGKTDREYECVDCGAKYYNINDDINKED